MQNHPDNTIPVAGGTDIMVKARSRDWYQDKNILDICHIPELSGIRMEADVLVLGACATAGEIAESSLAQERAPILVEACKKLAGPVVRNRATIGGNLANACLAGDMIPPLCVLDAEIVTVSPRGSRILNVNTLFKNVRACLNHETMSVEGCYFGCPAGKKTNLGADELIQEIRIPAVPERCSQRFIKVGSRKSGFMSRFTFACLMRTESGKIADLRLAIGAAFSDISVRTEVSEALLGRKGTEEEITAVADALGNAIEAQVRNVTPNIRYRADVCRKVTQESLLEMLREQNA